MSTPNVPQPRPKQANLYEFLFILRRRAVLIFLCLLGVLAPVVYHNRTASPVYRAETTIIFEHSKEPLPTLDLVPGLNSRSFITNQIEEIKSRTLAMEVAQALPERIVAMFELPDPSPPTFDKTRFIGMLIRKGLSAQPVRDSDIIRISIEGHRPDICYTVANTVTSVLTRRSVETRREEVRSVRNFVEDQLEIFSDQLQEAEEDLKRFKEENRLTSLDEESRAIVRRITEAEILHNKALTDRGATEQQLVHIQKKLEEQRGEVISSVVKTTSPWIRKLKETLIELEVQYTVLQVQDYPEDHPKMVRLKEEIDQTRGKLTRQALKLADGESMLDPLSQIPNFLQQIVSLQTQLEAHRSKEHVLEEVIDSYGRQLRTLPEKELTLAQLTRAKEVNDRIYMMLLEKREETRITEAGKISNLRVIDPAVKPSQPIKPQKGLNLILGAISGLILGMALAFFIESLDTSLKTIEDVERSTGISVLGSIPTIRIRRGEARGDEATRLSSRLVTHHDAKSSIAEAYRSLRTNILFSSPDNPLKVILVTSAGPGEGKSTTVTNLAITMAQQGTKTILVDTDLRRPVLHSLFGQNREPGLIDLLVGDVEMSDVIRETGVENLDLLACGVLPPNPAEMVGSEKMKALLDKLKAAYDVILMDSPPSIAVTDAAVLGSEVDAVCLVVQSGKTGYDTLQRAKSAMENVSANVLGAVLNNVDVESLYGSYRYYYYYYYTSSHEKKRRWRRKRRADSE